MRLKKIFISLSMLLMLGILISACETSGSEKAGEEQPEKEISKVDFEVTGMTCAECASTIDQTLTSVYGVESANISLENEHAVVTFDASKTNVDDMKKAVKNAGYSLEVAKN